MITGSDDLEKWCAEAHRHSSKHLAEIEASQHCGCFYCLQIFTPDCIASWTDGGQTAMCPKCGIDSVIGSASGFVVNAEFLRQMHTHYFTITTSSASESP